MPNNEKKSMNVQLILNLSILVFSIIAIFEHFLLGLTVSEAFTENLVFVVCAITAFLLIYILWILTQRFLYSNSLLLRISNVALFLFINCATIIVTGGAESRFKYLLLLSIMSATIEGSLPMGLSVSVISSVFLFTLDLFFASGVLTSSGTNIMFENDLILCCIFLLLTYLIGYWINMKEQHINSLNDMVSKDGLTDLYNYRYFKTTIDTLFNDYKKSGKPLSLLIMDIDWFKSYNDIYGHDKANEILQQIGRMMLQEFPSYCICSRYGGEEFAVILPNTSSSQAYDIAEKFRRIFEQYPFEGEKYLPHGVLTISIGISCIRSKTEDSKELIGNADEALYKAKFLRRNRTEIYTSFSDEFRKYSAELDNAQIMTTVKTLIAVINSKDKYTYLHSDRVFHYCEAFANYINLDDERKKTLVTAAYMHDIGKINISKKILLKLEKLTDEEFNEIKSHPNTGADIIQSIPELEEESIIVRQHHEKYDGTGYPQQIQGENICYLARILTLVDSYDAMTSQRPYKPSLTEDQAQNEILRCKSIQFDPELADKFVEFLRTMD
ncbi:MAG: diguanylate cyclase [Clostridiales bacterium]|nr:MAG: diguanylate cyclase [Clostridiales bacterium]